MELKFVWIDEYKNIEKQGFNFSPSHRFAYDPVSQILSFEDTGNDVIEDFFGEEFLNVTAIIGENGSGKSNLIEVLLLRLASFTNGWHITNSNFGLDILILDYTVFYSQNIEILDRDAFQSQGFVFYQFESSMVDAFVNAYEALTGINNTYVFYSPSFEFRSFSEHAMNLLDVSTNRLIVADQYSYPLLDNQNDQLGYFPDLSAHAFMEVRRHLDFISADIQNLPFKLPSFLDMKVPRYSKNKFLNKSDEWIEENEITDHINCLLQFEESLRHSQDEKLEKFHQILACSFLGSLIVSYPNIFKDLEIEILTTWIYSQEFPNDLGNDELDEKINQLGDFFQILKSLVNDDDVPIAVLARDRTDFHPERHEWDVNNLITVKVSNLSIDRIKQLHLLYSNIISTGPIINYFWEGLSSGERNLLNLFARLYSFQKQGEDQSQPNLDNIIIFLDEGASGFHPNWQKEYFESLIKTLPKIFCYNIDGTPNNRKVQLILTSHSPFVISNLPNGNIIFLKRDPSGKCIVADSLQSMKQTFGANIHTLFADSFFLDGLVGDFAQRKIDQVVQFLEGAEQMNLDEVKKLINVVGEPLIRRYLEKELEKFTRKIKVLELENEVRNLQNELNAMRNDQDQT